MARKIEEIKKEMTNSFIGNDEVKSIYGLNPAKTFEDEFSVVSLESILFYIVAFAMWTLEKLFDLHVLEVDAKIATLKPHSLKWYRNKAQIFQLGYALIEDSDIFDNGNSTLDQIESSKIIKYAAVTETTGESRLIVKIATEINGKLQPITIGQRNAFAVYMAEIKDAGVNLSIINYLPDLLYLNLIIYYNPLVLDAQGNSIVSGGKPVEDALEAYMKELPFNGELVLSHLVDKLQQVAGVEIPHLLSAQSNWIDADTDAYGPIQNIEVKKIPESGYYEIANYNNITYQPNE